MTISPVKLSITTDSGGAATVVSDPLIALPPGRVVGVKVNKGTLENTADITVSISDNATDWQTILTLTDVTASGMHPTGSKVAGSTDSYAPFLFTRAAQVVVAQGGSTKEGSVDIYVER